MQNNDEESRFVREGNVPQAHSIRAEAKKASRPSKEYELIFHGIS